MVQYKYDHALMKDCLLDLQFREGSGLVTRDWAKPHHKDPTLTGAPSWATVNGRNVLDFNSATPDFIQIAAADTGDLDFTSESFSIVFWFRKHTNTNFNLIQRALVNTDGWRLYLILGGYLKFATYSPAGVSSQTPLGGISNNIWYLATVTRDGSSVRLYLNGVD